MPGRAGLIAPDRTSRHARPVPSAWVNGIAWLGAQAVEWVGNAMPKTSTSSRLLKGPAPTGTPAGRKILSGLAEIAETLESGDESRLTARTVEVEEPGAYGAAAVKATRDRLDAR